MNTLKKSKTLQFLLVCVIGWPLLLICVAICIAVLFSAEAKKKEAWMSTGMPPVGREVCADMDIIEGAIIKENDVVELPEQPKNISPDALMCKELVVGQQACYTLPIGSVIRAKDLVNGEAKRAEQVRRFKDAGSKPSAICVHTTGTLYDLGEKANKACVALREIPEGELITIKDFELKEIKTDEQVADLAEPWKACGRFSRYGIGAGQQISKLDLQNSGKSPASIFFAAREIPPGKPVTKDDVTTMDVSALECPRTAITDLEILEGCVTHSKIASGGLIRATDFDLVGDIAN